MNVFLARHGQTEENLSRIFQGHLPGHLTEEGKRQAVALGESLKDIALDAIVSSDLQRVVDTVRLAVGNRDLPWEKNALFREIDWGSWTVNRNIIAQAKGIPLSRLKEIPLMKNASVEVLRL